METYEKISDKEVKKINTEEVLFNIDTLQSEIDILQTEVNSPLLQYPNTIEDERIKFAVDVYNEPYIADKIMKQEKLDKKVKELNEVKQWL